MLCSPTKLIGPKLRSKLFGRFTLVRVVLHGLGRSPVANHRLGGEAARSGGFVICLANTRRDSPVYGRMRGKREGLDIRHASLGCGKCASDAGESSMASATRAHREDSGRQDASGRIFSQSYCFAQFNRAHKRPPERGRSRGVVCDLMGAIYVLQEAERRPHSNKRGIGA